MFRLAAIAACSLVWSGCGRIGFGQSAEHLRSDASADGGPVSDAHPTANDAHVSSDAGDSGAPDDARSPPGDAGFACPRFPGCLDFSCPSSGRCYLACTDPTTTGIRSYGEAICYAIPNALLACIDDRAELDCIASHVASLGGERLWIGHEQDGSAVRPSDGWSCRFEPILEAWAAGQPDDGPRTPGIEDFEEQLAVFDVDGAAPNDASSLDEWPVLCEALPLP